MILISFLVTVSFFLSPTILDSLKSSYCTIIISHSNLKKKCKEKIFQ